MDAKTTGPYIFQSEAGLSIKEMRDTNATDYVTGDVLKLFGKDGFRIMTQLINNTNNNGQWPRDFNEATLMA